MTGRKEVQVLEQAGGVVSQQSDFLNLVERLATNPDADVAKIQQILDMQEQVLSREAKQAFNVSMATVQNKIELVVASETNQQTHSKYADLKAILIKVKPVYTVEGFSLMFYEGETAKENHKRVCVDIMHRNGHTEHKWVDVAIQTSGIAGKAMMTEIHGEGSAFSYGRRYLTCMIFNIPTGDDDGNGARGIEFITEAQKNALENERALRKVNGPKLLKTLKINSLDELPIERFQEAMKAIRDKPIPKTEREPGEDDGEWMSPTGETL